jgi:hypothetical protein
MSTGTPIIAALLTIGLLSFLFGCSKQGAAPAQSTTPKFAELSREGTARLEKQRGVVAAAAKQRYGTVALTKTKADLVVLQRLLDDRVFTKTQTYELQCLGIAFGDVLASELPLRWMMVTDEYGTDPTLRYKDTTIQINALTMLSKRVERDEEVDVQTMRRMTGEQVAQLEREFQK